MAEQTQRRRIAALARGVLDGTVAYSVFAAAVYEADQDDQIDELEGLITHMPAQGGLGGVSEEQFQRYVQDVRAIIGELEL